MADPFSIATGVLGVIGMAATLTKSLNDFAFAVRTSSEKISQIKTSTGILSHMLADLSPVLNDSSVGAHEKEVLEMCVRSCEENFDRLGVIIRPFMDDPEKEKEDSGKTEGEAERFGPLSPGMRNRSKAKSAEESKSKLKMKFRQLVWPFKEKETKELLEIITRTIQQLGLALDTVQSKTSLKILSLAEYQSQIVEDTQVVARSIESNTVEIARLIGTNSDTLDEIKSRTVSSSNAIELRLQKLEDVHWAREQDTQKLLLQLLEKFETSGSPNDINKADLTHAVDPLARQIIGKTLNRNLSAKSPSTTPSKAVSDPPPAYSPTDAMQVQGEKEIYSTTANDWTWDTPFGRVSVFTTRYTRDQSISAVGLPKDKSASRYKMMFTPAPWLYSKKAAFAFIKRVDGFGMQFTTPAIFKSGEPALRYLRRGEFDNLKGALSANGFLLNAVHESTGRTMLAEAVRCRRYDACRYLLELGADPETEDNRGSTLFNLLFNLSLKSYQVKRCLQIFSLLLETRADLFRGKATVMHSAVTTQYINIEPEQTREVLAHVYSSVSSFTSIDDPDVVGNSPLVSACTHGHDNPVVIDFLLRNGAARGALPGNYTVNLIGGVSVPMATASPAIYAAVRAGNIAVMRRLLEAGIPGDVNMRLGYGDTILHNNIRRSVKYNSPRRSSNSKVAGFQQKHEFWKSNFEYLVSKGADINATDAQGWTVLHWATNGPFCDEDMLQVLVDAGADLDIRDLNGDTAWDLAVRFKRVKLRAWKHFGAEMFRRGKLGQEELRGHIAKHFYLKGEWWKTESGEEEGEEEKIDTSMTQIPNDEEWMSMNFMHPIESEQVFGEDAKLDSEDKGAKYDLPRDAFWFGSKAGGRKKPKAGASPTRKAGEAPGQAEEGESGGRTWMGTVGNVLAAFVG